MYVASSNDAAPMINRSWSGGRTVNDLDMPHVEVIDFTTPSETAGDGIKGHLDAGSYLPSPCSFPVTCGRMNQETS